VEGDAQAQGQRRVADTRCPFAPSLGLYPVQSGNALAAPLNEFGSDEKWQILGMNVMSRKYRTELVSPIVGYSSFGALTAWTYWYAKRAIGAARQRR